MKKTKLFGISFAGLALFVLGAILGYYIGIFQYYEHSAGFTKRKDALQVRTESYEPSCEDLKSVGKPRVIRQGSDLLVMDVSEDYFVVFGLNAEPGKVPVTAWWGADRAAALRQACE